MLKNLIWIAVCSALVTACAGAQPQTPVVATLAPEITPLVTRVDNAPANNRLDAIRQAGVMRVGVSTDYPPFEYLDSNGNRVGFDIELMQETAGRMGVRLEWVDLPFDQLVEAVASGKVDGAISAFEYTPERDGQVDFTAPYYTAEDAFVSLGSFSGQIAAPEDAAAFTVGVQSGTAQETWLKQTLVGSGAMPESNVVVYDQVDSILTDLQSGKIQLLLADYIPAQTLTQNSENLKVAYHGVISGGPIHVIIPEGEAELKAAMDAVFQQLLVEGFIQQLAERYINEPN